MQMNKIGKWEIITMALKQCNVFMAIAIEQLYHETNYKSIEFRYYDL